MSLGPMTLQLSFLRIYYAYSPILRLRIYYAYSPILRLGTTSSELLRFSNKNKSSKRVAIQIILFFSHHFFVFSGCLYILITLILQPILYDCQSLQSSLRVFIHKMDTGIDDINKKAFSQLLKIKIH